MKTLSRVLWIFVWLFFAGLSGLGITVASAADFSRTEVKVQPHKADNYVLFADEVINDDRTHTQIARGNVQIISEPYILLADEVTYSKDQDLMTARGHVRVMQMPPPPNPVANMQSAASTALAQTAQTLVSSPLPGSPTEVLFADYLEMTSETNKGSIINARMLFSDNSRLVARDGKRYEVSSGQPITVLHDTLYSPCDLCKKNPDHAPLWQVHSSTFVHDTAAQEMKFYNATMQLYGTPVFYTPYFETPDPSVKQAAGFLPPVYLTSPYLGSLIRSYYYYPISPTQDTTAELSFATAQGPLIGLEWRDRFPNAQILLRGAATNSDLQTIVGDRGNQSRGYIAGTSLWDINSIWRAGFNLDYASDQNFLQQYKYDAGDDILTNRLYAERFKDRSYGVINAYAFQDLRVGSTGDQPNLLPYISYSDYSKPGGALGGRWGIQSSFLGIDRPYGGQSMQRLSGNINWQRNWFTPIGLKNTLTAQVREDIYQVQNADATEVGSVRAGQSYSVTRFAPTVNWQTSYPLVKSGRYLQYELEPLVAFTATPRVKNTAIPNEDSQDVELDATNLFNLSRYPGLDRLEDGERVTYGLRSSYTNREGGYFSTFIGQSDRLNGNNTFPTSSGLTGSSSDIVGQVTAAPSKYFDADYRIRMNHANLSAERHEATVDAGPDWLRFSTTYAFLKQVDQVFQTDLSGAPIPHQEIQGLISLKLNQYWQLSLSDTENLDHEPKALLTGVSLKYLDECFSILFAAQRDNTQSPGLPSGNSIYVTVGFKNLGNYSTPTFTPLSTANKTQ